MSRPANMVLIVDDENMIRRNLRALLEDLGYSVSEAANGREGLDVFDRERPDLVLTDLRMPVMDGLALIEVLREKSPETPIVVVSGTGTLREAVDAVRLGAWDYLIKPVEDANAFEIVIRRALERARLILENRRYQSGLEKLVQERTRELGDSETRFRRLIESVTSYIYTVTFADGSRRETVHGPGCLAVTGFASGEYAADADLWYRVAHEEDRPLVLDMSQRLLTMTAPLSFEHRIVNKDGSLRWVQSTLVPHRDAEGRLLSYDGIIADITERKRIEEVQLFLLQCGCSAQGEDFFMSLARYLAENLAMDYVRIDILEGEGLSARTLAVYNDGEFEENMSYALKGTPCGEVVGKTICCFPEGVRHQFLQDRMLQEMPAESYVGTTLWDCQGKPIGLIAVIGRQPLANPQLVSSVLLLVAVRAAGELERRQAEESLHKLSRAVEQSPVSIVITDTLGAIEFANPKFTREEALGQNPLIQKFGHISLEDYQKLWTTISTGKMWEGEFCNIKKTGDTLWEHTTISPIRNKEGAISNYLLIKEDITERKQLEEQLKQAQKMEAIGQLAGGLAHDFNNILTVILGYGNILIMENKLEERQREKVEQILAASVKAARLTRDLLTFSRKQIMHQKSVNLNEIVRHVEQFLVRTIGEDIQFKSALHEVNLPVKVDRVQIEQVLVNLATNARDAMPSGGGLVIETGVQVIDDQFIRAHGFGTSGHYACISVSDSGCGMDEETQKRIFEPFFTTKEVGKGTGLGMAIVFGIVKQHNGFINVYSEPGEGTTFRVYIPLMEEEQAAFEGIVAQVPPKGGNETILVAEDEAGVRKLMETILTNFGYEVILAEDGQECVDKFSANRDRVSLVLMDMIMPRKNGKEAYEEIRRLGSDVSVLYSTGYAPDFIQSRGVIEEGVELISKPVQPLELLRKVREILDKDMVPIP